MRLPAPALAAVLSLAACAVPPDLGEPPASETAGWPALVPADAILADVREAAITPGSVSDLVARAAALRVRAARLRATPIGG